MREFAIPCLYAALVWWFTTGTILFLNGRSARTFRWSIGAASLLLAGAVWALRTSAADTTLISAYVAFSSAILVWGWLEMSFLMGYITGPRKSGCPARCSGWRHFCHACAAIIYNELATVAAAICIIFVTWHMPNRVALWTFLVLWAMRISAKLNLFFGVPNVGEGFLPPHLHYLKSFFRKRTMNLLFPWSIVGSGVALVLSIEQYLYADGDFETASRALLITLLGLGLLEHGFMMVPMRSERLWSWALRSDPSNTPARLSAGEPVARTTNHSLHGTRG